MTKNNKNKSHERTTMTIRQEQQNDYQNKRQDYINQKHNPKP